MSTPAGWHRQDDGRERFWDGQQWTDHYRGGPQEPRPAKGGRWKHPIGYAATALVALMVGAGMGAAGGSATPTAGPTTTKTLAGATVTTTVTPPAATTVTKVATVKVTPVPKVAIEEGVWEVGSDIAPGRYKVIEPIAEECYWKIMRTGTDDIVQNDIPTGGRPVVVLRKGQTFTNQGCGDWSRIG